MCRRRGAGSERPRYMWLCAEDEALAVNVLSTCGCVQERGAASERPQYMWLCAGDKVLAVNVLSTCGCAQETRCWQ